MNIKSIGRRLSALYLVVMLLWPTVFLVTLVPRVAWRSVLMGTLFIDIGIIGACLKTATRASRKVYRWLTRNL